MKTSHFLILALLAPLSSCTNITMLGHVVAYDVNAEFKGDPVTPVSMNAGFESHSFAAVPPVHSGYWWQNFQSKFLPVGDALPTISKLKIQGVPTHDAWNGIAFDFVSSGATGEAAIAAAGGTPEGPDRDSQKVTMVNPEKAKDLGAEITKITTDPNSIPIR